MLYDDEVKELGRRYVWCNAIVHAVKTWMCCDEAPVAGIPVVELTLPVPPELQGGIDRRLPMAYARLNQRDLER